MIIFIHFNSAYGTYCLKDNTAPFCPATPDAVGDPRCCVNSNNDNEIAANPPEPDDIPL